MANGRMEPEVALYIAAVINWVMDPATSEPSQVGLAERRRLCDALVAIGCDADCVADLPRVILELPPGRWAAGRDAAKDAGMTAGADARIPAGGPGEA